jgi:hypothetical protein
MGEILSGADSMQVEREPEIDPASLAWKAKFLPLTYSRVGVVQRPLGSSDPGARYGATATLISSTHTLAEPPDFTSVSLVEEVGFEPT